MIHIHVVISGKNAQDKTITYVTQYNYTINLNMLNVFYVGVFLSESFSHVHIHFVMGYYTTH